MKPTRSLIGITSCIIIGIFSDAAEAQHVGQPAAGRVLAQQICSECHSIEKTQARSSNAAAPRFEVIANIPGMTSTALAATLQTSHRTMPNIILDPNGLSNVIAYILSLRQGT
jgi:mono/diheme cytochrome c family protein